MSRTHIAVVYFSYTTYRQWCKDNNINPNSKYSKYLGVNCTCDLCSYNIESFIELPDAKQNPEYPVILEILNNIIK